MRGLDLGKGGTGVNTLKRRKSSNLRRLVPVAMQGKAWLLRVFTGRPNKKRGEGHIGQAWKYR